MEAFHTALGSLTAGEFLVHMRGHCFGSGLSSLFASEDQVQFSLNQLGNLIELGACAWDTDILGILNYFRKLIPPV